MTSIKIIKRKKKQIPVKPTINKPPPLKLTQKSSQINQSESFTSETPSMIYEEKRPITSYNSYMSNKNNQNESDLFIRKKKSYSKFTDLDNKKIPPQKSLKNPPLPRGSIPENKYSGYNSRPKTSGGMLQYHEYIKQMQERNMRRKSSQKKIDAMINKYKENKVYRSRVSSAEIHRSSANEYIEKFGQKPSWYG